MAEEIETPAFDLLFRLNSAGTDFEYVEQDELEEVSNGVEFVLRTRLGQIEEQPDLGLTDPIFEEGDVDLEEIQSAIALSEDRAEALLEDQPDLLDDLVHRVTVNTQVRSDA